MFPKVIMHNTVSLDGSLKDFNIDMEQHYKIVSNFNADSHLIGSNTIKSGIEQFLDEIPKEKKSDFKKPIVKDDDKRPNWFIVDSNGALFGLIHVFRQYDYCKDIIILVSKKTDNKYLKYLEKRNITYHILGKDRVDLKKAIELISKEYNSKIILTDSGGTLNSLLLEKNLIDEISLIISQVIVGIKSTSVFNKNMFSKKKIDLELIKSKNLENNNILLHYKVLKGEKIE